MKKFFQKIFKKSSSNSLYHIKDIRNLRGKRVIVRAGFDIPLGEDGTVSDDEAWRITQSIPTLQFLKEAGARVIIISHIGRDPNNSLRPVAEYINNVLDIDIGFVPQVTGPLVSEAVQRLGNGQIVLLENLRSDEREIQNDQSLAQELAQLGEIYVNDAFSNAHREHTSIVSLPKLLPHYAGFEFMDEITFLKKALEPAHPLVFIVGGAKFETKLPLIKKMLPIANALFVGGALAHTFFKYNGYEIGSSLFEDEPLVKSIMNEENILLPIDVLVEKTNKETHVVQPTNVATDERIVDLGPQSLELLKEKITTAKTIVWNGPLGYYEGGYDNGTKQLLEIIGDHTNDDTVSILGGGDTVAVALKHNMIDQMTFVSTAGGAMLDYLVEGTLPAIKALQLPQ